MYCCVYSEKLLMMDRGTVEFYSKNKFEKSVHLVGFIIRTYHDARPPERYIAVNLFVSFGVFLAVANKKIKFFFGL